MKFIDLFARVLTGAPPRVELRPFMATQEDRNRVSVKDYQRRLAACQAPEADPIVVGHRAALGIGYLAKLKAHWAQRKAAHQAAHQAAPKRRTRAKADNVVVPMRKRAGGAQ